MRTPDLVVVLPHVDPSMRLVVGGCRVLNLHGVAVERLTGPERRSVLAAVVPSVHRTLLEAADVVLSSPDRDCPAEWLAAAGVVLLLGDPRREWSVRLRWDDLELVAGSTERSRDVVAAAGAQPFEDEVARACDEMRGRSAVVWVDRDQQLPAVVALARRLAGPMAVSGPFAARHWAVLRGLLPSGSELVPLAGTWTTRDPATGQELGWMVRPRGEHLHWVDEVAGQELTAVDELPNGCRAAIVAIATADQRGVRTADGHRWEWADISAAVRRLCARGAEVLVELWCPAPGETAQSCLRSAEHLAAARVPWRIAGCRPFHLRPDSIEWDVQVEPGLGDLARAASYPKADLTSTLPDIVAALRSAGRTAPHRTAAGYLECTVDARTLAPGVVVVTGPSGEDRLVDLGTARVLGIDSRIARRLRGLSPGTPVVDAFGSGVRDKILRLLDQAGVLAPVRPLVAEVAEA